MIVVVAGLLLVYAIFLVVFMVRLLYRNQRQNMRRVARLARKISRKIYWASNGNGSASNIAMAQVFR